MNYVKRFIKVQPPGRLIAIGFAHCDSHWRHSACYAFSVWDHATVTFVDALFTSTSAVCVTGLVRN